LDLHENSGLAALEVAGLMEAFWANHRPDLDSLRLTDAKGTVLHKHLRRTSGPGNCPQCLLLLMDSSQIVYFGSLNQGEKDVLPQTKIRARASITSLDTTR
jgi:hypothetical protein